MKGFLFGCLGAIVVLVAGATAYFGLGFAAVAADASPPAWETGLMSMAVHCSVGRRAAGIRSPFAPTDEVLISGGRLYLNDCVGCHGAPGKPDSDFGATFYPPAPPLPRIGTRYSAAEIFWVAKHGIRRTGMYSQSAYSDAQLWALASFIERIRSLPPAVSKGIERQPK